jgi:hypothetical protein
VDDTRPADGACRGWGVGARRRSEPTPWPETTPPGLVPKPEGDAVFRLGCHSDDGHSTPDPSRVARRADLLGGNKCPSQGVTRR